MTSEFVFLHKCIILDACCIINLYASGHFTEILEAIPTSVTVATYVQEKETLKIRSSSPAEHGMPRRTEQIDLQPAINRGLLLSVSPESEAENATYAEFLDFVDIGEAITGAIAVHRNWAIGSDDRQALSLFAKTASHLQVLSTLDLLKYWVDATDLPTHLAQAALQNVRVRGRYEPYARHALRYWWKTILES